MTVRPIGERPGTMLFLNVTGILALVAGILALLIGFGDPSLNSAGLGIGLIISGFVFLAFAKIVDLLCEISDNTRKT